MKKLKKAAAFTDIHFGAKSNSDLHNDDCLEFIDWFCENVKSDPSIDHIIFLGDWHENRASINLNTLNASYEGALKLNALGLPIFFIVGNHDLFRRSNRDIHSVPHFVTLENFIVVDQPKVFDLMITPTLISPYLFSPEYQTIGQDFSNADVWWGHFEFKDFIITGYNIKMMEGPDIKNYKDIKRIFSGHFHKRQTMNNVTYIGNTFPTTFADVDDFDRGMMTYDYVADETTFTNWIDCPKYIRTSLNDIFDETVKLYEKARVKCILNIDISYDESTVVKQQMIEKYNLREFIFEEMTTVEDHTKEITNVDVDNFTNINELIVQLLDEVEGENINNNLLSSIYKELKI